MSKLSKALLVSTLEPLSAQELFPGVSYRECRDDVGNVDGTFSVSVGFSADRRSTPKQKALLKQRAISCLNDRLYGEQMHALRAWFFKHDIYLMSVFGESDPEPLAELKRILKTMEV